jgi:2'-5' RNA ligase
MANRYFIAIIPPIELKNTIEEMKNEIAIKYNSKAALRSPAHITLHMPFDLDKKKEERFLDKIQRWEISSQAFPIVLKNFSCFRPRVIFVDVVQDSFLNLLQGEVVEYMKLNFNIFNQSDDLRGFHPHVTIGFRDLHITKFEDAWKYYSKKTIEAEFMCNSFWILRWEINSWKPIQEVKLR